MAQAMVESQLRDVGVPADQTRELLGVCDGCGRQRVGVSMQRQHQGLPIPDQRDYLVRMRCSVCPGVWGKELKVAFPSPVLCARSGIVP
jgi:hypothetical protein